MVMYGLARVCLFVGFGSRLLYDVRVVGNIFPDLFVYLSAFYKIVLLFLSLRLTIFFFFASILLFHDIIKEERHQRQKGVFYSHRLPVSLVPLFFFDLILSFSARFLLSF